MLVREPIQENCEGKVWEGEFWRIPLRQYDMSVLGGAEDVGAVELVDEVL